VYKKINKVSLALLLMVVYFENCATNYAILRNAKCARVRNIFMRFLFQKYFSTKTNFKNKISKTKFQKQNFKNKISKNKFQKQITKTNYKNKFQKQISKTNFKNKFQKQIYSFKYSMSRVLSYMCSKRRVFIS
jgi:hypothetical protein